MKRKTCFLVWLVSAAAFLTWACDADEKSGQGKHVSPSTDSGVLAVGVSPEAQSDPLTPSKTHHCIGAATPCKVFNIDIATACEKQQGCNAKYQCRTSLMGCSLLSDEVECEMKGCQWRGNCNGTAKSCALLSTYTCETQKGCYLSELAGIKSCNGYRSCFTQSEKFTCNEIIGCNWSGTCDGPSDNSYCRKYQSESGCKDTKSICEWGYQECEGEVQSCESFSKEQTCSAQEGCEWVKMEE